MEEPQIEELGSYYNESKHIHFNVLLVLKHTATDEYWTLITKACDDQYECIEDGFGTNCECFVVFVPAGLDLDLKNLETTSDNHMEGWLSVPNKQNIKKYGWRKQYVVVSSRKVLFYSIFADKQKSAPMLVLDIEKLYHVRSVTQGDVYRADAKDIPRIFQVLYATEGENRKTEENQLEISNQPQKAGAIDHKGHEFIELHFRTPTTCDSCNKPMWHMIHPPNAMECRRCHFRVHKDHFDKKEEFVGYCKVNFDQNIQAKELLLLADTSDDQKMWVMHLSKKISKKGIVSQGTLGTSNRNTKQYSSFGASNRAVRSGSSATLPPNMRPN